MNWTNLFELRKIDDKYRITYLQNESITVSISTEFIGIEWISQTKVFTFSSKGVWFVPNFDYRGCSKIILTNYKTQERICSILIDKNLSNFSKSQNIICVGLNKSGTSSFIKSFEEFGYKSFDKSILFHKVVPDIYHNDLSKLSSVLSNPNFNLFSDMPFSFPEIYKKCYQLRPNDIYVLTLRRSSSKWADSVINFYEMLQNKELRIETSFIDTLLLDGTTQSFVGYLHPLFSSWGITNLENLKQQLINVYEKHAQDCIEFFKGKNNFFVVEIEKQGELKKLTDWLGLKNTTEDFPWENKNE